MFRILVIFATVAYAVIAAPHKEKEYDYTIYLNSLQDLKNLANKYRNDSGFQYVEIEINTVSRNIIISVYVQEYLVKSNNNFLDENRIKYQVIEVKEQKPYINKNLIDKALSVPWKRSIFLSISIHSNSEFKCLVEHFSQYSEIRFVDVEDVNDQTILTLWIDEDFLQVVKNYLKEKQILEVREIDPPEWIKLASTVIHDIIPKYTKHIFDVEINTQDIGVVEFVLDNFVPEKNIEFVQLTISNISKVYLQVKRSEWSYVQELFKTKNIQYLVHGS